MIKIIKYTNGGCKDWIYLPMDEIELHNCDMLFDWLKEIQEEHKNMKITSTDKGHILQGLEMLENYLENSYSIAEPYERKQLKQEIKDVKQLRKNILTGV